MGLLLGVVFGGQQSAEAFVTAAPSAEGYSNVGVVAGSALYGRQVCRCEGAGGGEGCGGIAEGVLCGDTVELHGSPAEAAAMAGQPDATTEFGGDRGGVVGELAHAGPVVATGGGVGG